MPLTRRYSPEIAPGEGSIFGMDFTFVIPPGVGISSGTLQILTNTNPPLASSDLELGTVVVSGRALYCLVVASAAAEGKDYQLLWTATDGLDQQWPRTALVLCARTS